MEGDVFFCDPRRRCCGGRGLFRIAHDCPAPRRRRPRLRFQRYVDSTARCSGAAVLFGSTDSSRVAICKTSGGYEYRGGVRVRDGAKLVLSASGSGDGSYTAVNDGISYTVSSSSLTVSMGGSVIRKESWLDFHGPQTSTSTTTGTSSSPTTSSTPISTTPTSTTPLPPPLPAEVGGGGHH